ncbi:endonuclease III domain-containing protein [Fundidesulfovibrio putealis]|uniref:endonuclease III domain-containing protein n=1 Tax=Fundidesulfovibrio putealis TaxID=270496 RepID=UPI0004836DE5|nr:endonuclease [Fundidesulfovibrio putealis]
MQRRDVLLGYYQAMLSANGPRNWWPAKTPFEVCVGAVLTQNTAWKGVEKALSNLERAGALDPRTLHSLSLPDLERLIHPAGYFRVKARRLRNLLDYLAASCDFDLGLLAERDMADVRGELLEVSGIGPETADSILCYALQMPSFVVDAYTRRILSRHGLLPEDADYEETRDFFMDVLDPDPALLGDFHAQLVGVGNQYCKTRNQLCDTCPLGSFLS